MTDRTIMLLALAAVALLIVKFFLPLFSFDQPLGYDAGLYRRLFLSHAEGFPPFHIAVTEPWAREHPLGLFFFSTILLRIGVPVDWLIGWIWNLFPVILAGAFAWATKREHGPLVALGTLIAALFSVAYFDGFAAMYWKTYASLLFVVLAFSAMERRSFLSVPFGALAIATHHQTGLLFGLTVGTWVIVSLVRSAMSKKSAKKSRRKLPTIALTVGAAIVMGLLGAAVYAPVWNDAVLHNLPALLGQADAPGNFPPPAFYLQAEWMLLALGAWGFFLSVRRKRWSSWQLAVLWSFAFVALRLVFYRRFFLQLDFFLLPFAGIALADLWMRYPRTGHRCVIALLACVQLFLTYHASLSRTPAVEKDVFDAVIAARTVVPKDALVLALENESSVVLLGWLPDVRAGGPGVFESTWTYEHWRQFFLSGSQRRAELLADVHGPVYLFATPYFRTYYGDIATEILTDPCLEPTASPMLYRVTCPTKPAQP